MFSSDLLSPTVKSKYSLAARKYKLFAGELLLLQN